MFIFDATNVISYEDFNSFLTKEKRLLESKKQQLFEKYSIMEQVSWDENKVQFNLFRTDYNRLIRQSVYAVIAYYRSFLPKECLIVEFGSFVKGTERILSDIDLTICYDEIKTEHYECAEMLINYTITQLLNFSIDHIHGKFQHYPLMSDFDHLTEADNHYRLQFSEHHIDFQCGPETLQENLMNIKNVRDYSSMLEGYEEKYLLKCDIDCLYSIHIIENTMKHDFISDLAALEQRYDICSDYQFNTKPSELASQFSISELKRILKHHGVVEFYIFLAKLRKVIPFALQDYSMDMECLRHNPMLNEYFGEDYISQLFEAFLKLVFFWNRMELSLSHRNIALSTRCHQQFTLTNMDQLLQEDWGGS